MITDLKVKIASGIAERMGHKFEKKLIIPQDDLKDLKYLASRDGFNITNKYMGLKIEVGDKLQVI